MKKWTRSDFLIALNLYTKLPFGQFHARNSTIRTVASKLGRSPASLAMKLGNFASLDPVQQARGVKGLAGATKQDREMWNEFFSNLVVLGPESENLLAQLLAVDGSESQKTQTYQVDATTERETIVKQRRGQQFFREAVICAFGSSCCITGLSVPELLRASHILPWSTHIEQRLNPSNGLCLSALHDAAFDRGLITFDEQFRMVLSVRLRDAAPAAVIDDYFLKYENSGIRLPLKTATPDPSFMAYHRERIFRNN